MYVMTFTAESGREFTVVASNQTLKTLVQGKPNGGGGELKGCDVKFPGRRKPPFTYIKDKEAA